MKITIYTLIFITLITIESCSKKAKDTEHEKTEHSDIKTAHEEGVYISKAQFDAAKMSLGSITTQNFPEVVKTTGMIENISVELFE